MDAGCKLQLEGARGTMHPQSASPVSNLPARPQFSIAPSVWTRCANGDGTSAGMVQSLLKTPPTGDSAFSLSAPLGCSADYRSWGHLQLVLRTLPIDSNSIPMVLMSKRFMLGSFKKSLFSFLFRLLWTSWGHWKLGFPKNWKVRGTQITFTTSTARI